MSTIEDERVERMRAAVMRGVDADVRQRAGRLRRIRAGVIGGACVVVAVGVMGPLLSTGVGTSDDSAGSDSTAEIMEPQSAADSAAGGSADADAVAPEDVARATSKREVIVTGSAHVVTSDPADASSRLATWVEGRQGRVDSRQLSTADSDYASITVRVPSDEVSATVDHLDTYGTVDSVSLSNDDVTSTVRDLETRISALRVSIERLEGIVADSANSDELVRAEQALTDRQSQLEQLLTQQASLGEQVSLATISVEFSAEARADDVDPGGFLGGLVSGWNALVGAFNAVVELVGVLLPWLAVALLGYAGYRVVRRVRGRGWN